MSRRGTTPTQTFRAKIDLTDVSELFLTYVQDDMARFEKTLEDVTVEPIEEGDYKSLVTVTLTQADTLALKADDYYDIQARVKFPDGKALASDILNVPVLGILKEGII